MMASRWGRLGAAVNKAVVPVAASKPGGWMFTHVFYRIDLPLMRLSQGRLRLGFAMPHAIVTTTGARSAQPRSLPVLYFKDGNRFVIVASNGGSTSHPAWYHNLRAEPSATISVDGNETACRAREADGEERARLWAEANAMYPGFTAYQSRAGRRIPVMVLDPV